MRPIQSILAISEEDRARGELTPESMAYGAKLFETFGFLMIERALEPSLVVSLQEAYFERYVRLPRPVLDETCLRVGDERYMISVAISGPFASPHLYGNPFFLPILERLLSPKLVINSFGSVCAFPGSKDQHVHLDHPWLFESSQISAALPTYAITVVMGLVDLNLTVGTTAVWEGSHRGGHPKAMPFNPADAALPMARMGDVYLMDYRLVHGGTANNSARPRPIMYLVYSRPWFSDAANFTKQPPVILPEAALHSMPERLKQLFRNSRPVAPNPTPH